MKTLEKRSFKDVKIENILDVEKMRSIRGGEMGPTMPPRGTCGINWWKDGKLIKCQREISKEEAINYQNEWTTDPDGQAFYDNVYWCCDNCTDYGNCF